jgi:hypothetical protein
MGVAVMNDAGRSTNNNTSNNNALDVALDLIRRGWKPVPVPIGGKGPVIPGWQHLDITAENVGQYFNRPNLNAGAIMGPRSGGLTDVDLDCAEAIRLAPSFLPETRSVYGRPGKRRSHYLYILTNAPEPKASIQLKDESKKMIVELRMGGGGKGAQSIMPGSVHPSGETYEWHEDTVPAQVTCSALKTAVTKVAVGAMMMRHLPEFGRHDVALGIGGFLARAGWSPDAVGSLVATICHAKDNDERANEHARTAKEAVEAFVAGREARGFPWLKDFLGENVAKTIAKIIGYRDRTIVEPETSDGRPAIKIERLISTADQAEEVLKDAGVEFYERANALVRPIVKEVDTFHGKKTSTAQLAKVSHTYIRAMMSRVANWYRLDRRAREWVVTDPPHDVADTVLDRAGDWIFPTVAGIITTQTMRPDGTILDQPGYDPDTRLLLVDPPAMVPIPDSPTREDAVASLALLEDLTAEFAFVDETARAVALSAIITPVVRGAFDLAPMHVADAPTAGSGKSYLFNTVSAIALGQAMAVIAAGRNEEETEKRLGAAVMAGQPLITIDNVNGELKGDALCQIIEQLRPQVRILGKSELIEVEARSTTMFANGNNIVVVGDLCRRVVRVKLDTKQERPELKVYTGNPVATVLANRGAYIAAALTICRAYIVAGRPGLKPRLASFEGWSDTVRSALTWLGKADPVASMETIRDEDPDKAALITLLDVWAETIGTGYSHRVALKEVIELVNKKNVDRATNPPTFTSAHPELSSAVHAIIPGRQPDAASLGYWMRGRKNRIVNGMWFEMRPDSHEGSKWWVVRSDGVEGPGAM